MAGSASRRPRALPGRARERPHRAVLGRVPRRRHVARALHRARASACCWAASFPDGIDAGDVLGDARRCRPTARSTTRAWRSSARRVVPDGVPHRGARRRRALDPRVHARDAAGRRQRAHRRHRHRRHRPARERGGRRRARGRAARHARPARLGARRARRVPLRLALPGRRAGRHRLRVDAAGDLPRQAHDAARPDGGVAASGPPRRPRVGVEVLERAQHAGARAASSTASPTATGACAGCSTAGAAGASRAAASSPRASSPTSRCAGEAQDGLAAALAARAGRLRRARGGARWPPSAPRTPTR